MRAAARSFNAAFATAVAAFSTWYAFSYLEWAMGYWDDPKVGAYIISLAFTSTAVLFIRDAILTIRDKM